MVSKRELTPAQMEMTSLSRVSTDLASVRALPTPSGLVARMMTVQFFATSVPFSVALQPRLVMSFLRSSFLQAKSSL
jgi:hypothetical protein